MSNSLTVVATRNVLNQSLTIYGDKENPLFLAKDVAAWIEHTDVSTMIRSIDDDEKVTNIVCTLGGNQQAWFLTESGLYEVLMLSRKPIAKQFKKEVKRILHELRTNGTVSVKQPELPLIPEENTKSTAELAASLGVSSSQIHGILQRNRSHFTEGTDIIKQKQLYFTASGEEKLRSLAALTTFQHRTGFTDGEDVIAQEFARLGYSPAMYLTYLMLINWYELDDRRMFEVVSMLNRINGTKSAVFDPMNAAVSAATSISRVRQASGMIVDTLMQYASRLGKDTRRKIQPVRVPSKMAEELSGSLSNPVMFRHASMNK